MKCDALSRVVVLVTAFVAGAACASTPLNRPVRVSEVDTGAGSLQAVRQRLSGTWDLVSYSYVDGQGNRVGQTAQGHMTYDEYGNLALSGVIRGGSGGPDQSVDYSTRVVIDTLNECIHLANPDELEPLDLPAAVDPRLPRFYVFEGDTLRLSVRDSGREVGNLVWRKRPHPVAT